MTRRVPIPLMNIAAFIKRREIHSWISERELRSRVQPSRRLLLPHPGTLPSTSIADRNTFIFQQVIAWGCKYRHATRHRLDQPCPGCSACVRPYSERYFDVVHGLNPFPLRAIAELKLSRVEETTLHQLYTGEHPSLGRSRLRKFPYLSSVCRWCCRFSPESVAHVFHHCPAVADLREKFNISGLGTCWERPVVALEFFDVLMARLPVFADAGA